MRCVFCGEPIMYGDDVVSFIRGNAEFKDENSNEMVIDVVESTDHAHYACFKSYMPVEQR